MIPSRPDPRWPDRRFADLLGSRHPILLAPMAGAGGVELAVAAALVHETGARELTERLSRDALALLNRTAE